MRRLHTDLAAVVVLAGVAALVNLLPLDQVPLVRLISALVFTLIAPGYAVTAALFPRATLRLPERALFSVGMSLALIIVTGIVLNELPSGLDTRPWVVALGIVVLVASAIAWRRRRALVATPEAAQRAKPSLIQGTLLGVAAAICMAAVVVARTPAPHQGLQGYSQLWMLPGNDPAQTTVRLGLASEEFAATQYRLEVEVGDQTVQEWASLTLQPGQTWESNIVVPDQVSATSPLKAFLYRLDAPERVYRQVEWWPPAP